MVTNLASATLLLTYLNHLQYLHAWDTTDFDAFNLGDMKIVILLLV